MKITFLLTVLVVVAALSMTDAGLIKLALRAIKIGVKAIVGAVTGGGTAAVVTSAVLTATDLALNLGNVLSGGCMYEKEICTLTPEIERLEKEMVPLYNQLTLLDQKNSKTYADLSKSLDKQNQLATLANKLQQLVVSIIQKLGSPSQLDNLGKEFESNTSRLVDTFKQGMDEYKKSMEKKAIKSGIFDSGKLLYYGGKQAYITLRAAGKISSFKELKTMIFPKKTGSTSFTKSKLFTKVSSSLTTVKTFFKKPSVVKFARKAASGGMVLGAVVGLGLTLAVDIPAAKKMRDSLRNTRDEMRSTLNQLPIEIRREQQSERDLATVFQEVRTNYGDLVKMINPSLKSDTCMLNTNGGSTPAQLYNYQVQAISVLKRLNAELEKMDINVAVIKEVGSGVEMGDYVGTIRTSIVRKGLGSFSESDILNIIAEHNPKMNSYKGYGLERYRGSSRELKYVSKCGDCPGNDLWDLVSTKSTLEDCARRCSIDNRCKAFQFDDGNSCYPKTKVCPVPSTAYPGKMLYIKPGCATGRVPNYFSKCGDCPGNDLWDLVSTQTNLEDCAKRCSSDDRCKAFQFDDSNRCYPKTNACAVPSTDDPGKAMYIPKCAAGRVPNYFSRCGDCPGNDLWDLVSTKSNLEDCAKRCSSDDRCKTFQFDDSNRCYPKKKSCQVPSTDDPGKVMYMPGQCDPVEVEGFYPRCGDCNGNDLYDIYADRTTLAECARRCSNDDRCKAFTFHDGYRCYPKTKACDSPSTANIWNVFYTRN